MTMMSETHMNNEMCVQCVFVYFIYLADKHCTGSVLQTGVHRCIVRCYETFKHSGAARGAYSLRAEAVLDGERHSVKNTIPELTASTSCI